MQARDIMCRTVVTVTPTTTVKVAANLLATNGFTALPVVDEDHLLTGIVTEADLIRNRFPRDPRYYCTDAINSVGTDSAPDPPAFVGAVMSTPAVSVDTGTDVVDLVTTMLSGGLRSIPIVDGSRVVGIVTRRDLVRILARDDQKILTDVRHQLAMYAGARRWTVDVHDGAVTIGDELDDLADRHVVKVLAEAVPGVTVVHMAMAHTRRPDHQHEGEHLR